MPTYEYECHKCHHHFDAFQSMSADAYKTCPKEHCQMDPWGKGKVKRLIGAGAGLLFKGSGFYITDYRSEGYKSSAKKDASGGGATASSAEKKGSSTAEAKKTPAKKETSGTSGGSGQKKSSAKSSG